MGNTGEQTSAFVTIYSDGACSPNPGRGGYGVILLEEGERRELSGGFRLTTNNRMELLSVIAGIQALRSSRAKVVVFSDSRYVIDAFSSRHAHRWQRQNWMRTRRDAAKNPDLWEQLLTICEKHTVEMKWVAGHTGHVENERCDALAVEARLRDDLPEDEGYLQLFTPRETVQTQFDLL